MRSKKLDLRDNSLSIIAYLQVEREYKFHKQTFLFINFYREVNCFKLGMFIINITQQQKYHVTIYKLFIGQPHQNALIELTFTNTVHPLFISCCVI